MSEPTAASRSWPRRLLLLLLVALLAAGVAAIVRWTSDALETLTLQDELIRRLAHDVQRIEAENADTARIAVNDKAALAALTERLNALEQSAAKLTDTVQNGRLRVQAAADALLLREAMERGQVARGLWRGGAPGAERPGRPRERRWATVRGVQDVNR